MEDVGTSTTEERTDTLGLKDDLGSVEGVVVLDTLTRGHHHATTDGVNGVGAETGGGGDNPTKQEVGEEVTLHGGRHDGLCGIVETEVETTVDEDTDSRDDETTVETGDSI